MYKSYLTQWYKNFQPCLILIRKTDQFHFQDRTVPLPVAVQASFVTITTVHIGKLLSLQLTSVLSRSTPQHRSQVGTVGLPVTDNKQVRNVNSYIAALPMCLLIINIEKCRSVSNEECLVVYNHMVDIYLVKDPKELSAWLFAELQHLIQLMRRKF